MESGGRVRLAMQDARGMSSRAQFNMSAAVSTKPFLFRLGEFIRFSHTIFALPFALVSMLVAGGGRVPWRVFAWILICMVSARTAAMCFNRLTDWGIDKGNPRTASRHTLIGRSSAILTFILSLVIL